MDDVSYSDALAAYEERAQSARAGFARNAWVTRLLAGELAPAALESFLLWFCALGVQMTAPVEGWIRRAGERCTAVGFNALGAALEAHARHEAGHDAMMVRDTYALAARRAAAGRGSMDARSLLAHPATPGVVRYARLHEDVIAGAAPYAQIAIEYEIERLSVAYGPGFVAQCEAGLGHDVKRCLSFVEDHVELDVGHTRFNARQLGRFLQQHPEALDGLVAAGAEALAAYGQFLEDCLGLALSAPAGAAAS